jgi:hypothetical protein
MAKNVKKRPKESYRAKTPEVRKRKLDNSDKRWPERLKTGKGKRKKMSVKVDFDADYLVEDMNKVKIACDNFAKAMAKYVAKNKYKILKELIEENNKIMKG